MSPPRDHESRFVSRLQALVPKTGGDDPQAAGHRAALAALRRCLGKPTGAVVEAYQYVMPYLPAGATQPEEDAYFLVAALFALHPHHWDQPEEDRRKTNFGASFSLLCQTEGVSESVEKRFVALLDAPPETLANHLRQAISLLRSRDIPVNYSQLLRDVQWWGLERRSVQRGWARAFWGGYQGGEDATGVGSQIAPSNEEDAGQAPTA
jgi:CRISPR system Cascade subunit CasB